MNNIELEKRMLAILDNENFFDMMVEIKSFEKEYKESDFYKITKMPLLEVSKEFKIFNELKLNNLFAKIQDKIDNLSFEKFYEFINKSSDMFDKEDKEIRQILQDYKDLKF